MKLYLRLLLTIPFVVVIFWYYKIENPDVVCNGPISAIIMLIFWVFLLLTGILAAIATLRKRQLDKPSPEPISLLISLVTLLFLIYSITLRGHRNGDKWIYAECKNLNDWQESKDLTLRKNGNFTFSPNSDCAFSGEFKKIGDTIILSKKTIDMTTNEMTTVL